MFIYSIPYLVLSFILFSNYYYPLVYLTFVVLGKVWQRGKLIIAIGNVCSVSGNIQAFWRYRISNWASRPMIRVLIIPFRSCVNVFSVKNLTFDVNYTRSYVTNRNCPFPRINFLYNSCGHYRASNSGRWVAMDNLLVDSVNHL